MRNNQLLTWPTNCREYSLKRWENTAVILQLLTESIAPTLFVCCPSEFIFKKLFFFVLLISTSDLMLMFHKEIAVSFIRELEWLY